MTFLQLQVRCTCGLGRYWEEGTGARLHWLVPRAQYLHRVLSIGKIPVEPLLCNSFGYMEKEKTLGDGRKWEESMEWSG